MKKFYIVCADTLTDTQKETIYSWVQLEKLPLPFKFKAFATETQAKNYVQKYSESNGGIPSEDAFQSYPDVICKRWCTWITCTFVLGIGLLIPGILFLSRTARIPERWSAVQCFVSNEKEAIPQSNPLVGDEGCKPTTSLNCQRGPYNYDGSPFSPSNEFVCQLQVRVVYPPNIFIQSSVTTTEKLLDGKKVKTYTSGPIPNGFSMPKNGTNATMYSAGRTEKGSKTYCWDLKLKTNTAEQSRSKQSEIEVQCEIFNASALKEGEFPNPKQTLLYMGNYVASPNSVKENVYDPNHVKYSDQKISNPFGLTALLVGILFLMSCWAASAVHFGEKFYRELCIQYMCCIKSNNQHPDGIRLQPSSSSNTDPASHVHSLEIKMGKQHQLKHQHSNPL